MKSVFQSLLLLACAFASAQSKPFVLGSIEEIQSQVLSEKRTLNVYFPEGYNDNDSIKYPVIYLLDGSADEDFIHIAGLVQFANFQWIDLLPKSIIVGIANIDRKRDFSFPTTIQKDKDDFPTTGGSAKFIEFIEKELQPFVDKKYRTNDSKMIIGQSLGGLLASEILIKKPELFSSYLIVSPSFWWDKESLLRMAANSKMSVDKKTTVYIAVGNEGKIMVNDAKQFFKILKKNNVNAAFNYFGKEDHATIFHQAVYDAFVKFKEMEKGKG